MKLLKSCAAILTGFTLSFPLASFAADYPTPQSNTWIASDFRFHTGEVMHEMKMGYTTLGNPKGDPVLVLHGTTGSAASMLTPVFAGELFGPGQPLDATKHFIILPDSIGTGKTAKPSDGLRMAFPRYNYDDMVEAQYRLLTEHLGVHHLRVVVGNSMGGMQTWIWAEKHPNFMDIAVPLASLPTEMSGRNWMMRRLLTEAIRQDPEWKDGNYAQQPPMAQFASLFFATGTNGGNQGLYKLAPTREKADALVQSQLKKPFTGDANDYIYQWDASRDYNPEPGIESISAVVLAINSADDERNPPELGLLDATIKRVKNGRALVVPSSPDTAGHGTAVRAKYWAKNLADLLENTPRRATAGNP